MRIFKRLGKRVRGTATVERKLFEIISEALLQEIAIEEEAALLSGGSRPPAVRVADPQARERFSR